MRKHSKRHCWDKLSLGVAYCAWLSEHLCCKVWQNMYAKQLTGCIAWLLVGSTAHASRMSQLSLVVFAECARPRDSVYGSAERMHQGYVSCSTSFTATLCCYPFSAYRTLLLYAVNTMVPIDSLELQFLFTFHC